VGEQLGSRHGAAASPLAQSAFQNADGESCEWLIEKMYATSRKFYCEYAHVLVQRTSRHYYMTRVFVPENWNVQGRHVTSPIMATASWAVADGSPKPSWACENRINSVHGEIALCEFMVPIYRVWADLDENDLLKPQILAWCDDVLPQLPRLSRVITPDNSETRWERMEIVTERPQRRRIYKR